MYNSNKSSSILDTETVLRSMTGYWGTADPGLTYKKKRKVLGKSSKSDLRGYRKEDYWKNVENYDPFGGVKFDAKQAEDIVSKVAKGKQGN